MAALAEQSQGLITFVESHLDDFGALGDENTFPGFQPVAELGFSKCAEDLHARLLQGCYFYNHV